MSIYTREIIFKNRKTKSKRMINMAIKCKQTLSSSKNDCSAPFRAQKRTAQKVAHLNQRVQLTTQWQRMTASTLWRDRSTLHSGFYNTCLFVHISRCYARRLIARAAASPFWFELTMSTIVNKRVTLARHRTARFRAMGRRGEVGPIRRLL